MSGMLDGVNAREINKTREEERGVRDNKYLLN